MADVKNLSHQHCVPCEGGTAPFTTEEENAFMTAVTGWQLEKDGHHQITKEITLKNFVQAVELIQKIGQIAENEGHHPNLYLHNYKQLRIELYTHAVGGLSANDFILASRIDEILPQFEVKK